jgi:hypothetical protein
VDNIDRLLEDLKLAIERWNPSAGCLTILDKEEIGYDRIENS